MHLDGLKTIDEDRLHRAGAMLTEALTAAGAAFRRLTRLTKLYIADSDASWVAALPLLPTLRVRTDSEG